MYMSKKNILILGGLGFIGRNLTAELAAHHQVTVFDRAQARFQSNVEAYAGDFFNIQDVENVLQTKHFDTVIHLVSSTIPSSSDPVYDIESNVVGTVRLLDLLKKYVVPNIVFASSGGTVYGNIDQSVKVNELHPTHPISAHGVNKLAIEKYIQLYHHLHGLNYLILRFSNPYGQYHQSDRQGFINVALKKILRGEPVEIWGDGSIVRDYIYVQDLAVITRQLIEGETSNDILNIGTGVGYSINDVLNLLRQEVGEFQVTKKHARNFDVPRIVLENKKLQSKINFHFTSIADGIQQTHLWLKSQG